MRGPTVLVGSSPRARSSITAPPIRPPTIRPFAPSRPVTDSIDSPSSEPSNTTSIPSPSVAQATEASLAPTPTQRWEKPEIGSGATSEVGRAAVSSMSGPLRGSAAAAGGPPTASRRTLPPDDLDVEGELLQRVEVDGRAEPGPVGDGDGAPTRRT